MRVVAVLGFGALVCVGQDREATKRSVWRDVRAVLPLSLLISTILNLFLMIANPWGLDTVNQSLSAEVALYINAPIYAQSEAAREAADRIGMVLIDDATLRSLDTTFPVRYDHQLSLLESIADGEDRTPIAVFLDLIYLTDREGWLGEFSSILAGPPDDDPVTQRTGMQQEKTFDALSLALGGGRTGILGADKLLDLPQPRAGQPADERWWSQRASLLDAQNAPSLIASAPARYALAPAGHPSPALVLAMWTCAYLKGRQPDSPTGLPGCETGEGPIRPEAVRAASRANAEAEIALECAQILRNPVPPGSPGPGCEEAALTYLSSAAWAPEATAVPEDSFARILAEYEAARRAGIADAVRAFLDFGCGGRFSLSVVFSGQPVHDQGRCQAFAKARAEARVGPAAALVWGGGPNDIHQLDDKTEIAAPYVRAAVPADVATSQTVEGGVSRPEDPCERYRLDDESVLAATLDGLQRGVEQLFSTAWITRGISRCPYHALAGAHHAVSDNDRTRSWVDHVVNERVVLVGASVTAAPDLHEMRRTFAPGVWAHAMALDNMLALGANYRSATLIGHGFKRKGLAAYALNLVLETALQTVLIVILIAIGSASLAQKLASCLTKPRFGFLSEKFFQVALEILAGAAITLLVALPVAVVMLMVLPFPPIDWLGIGSASVVALAMMDQSGKTSEPSEDPDTTKEITQSN